MNTENKFERALEEYTRIHGLRGLPSVEYRELLKNSEFLSILKEYEVDNLPGD